MQIRIHSPANRYRYYPGWADTLDYVWTAVEAVPPVPQSQGPALGRGGRWLPAICARQVGTVTGEENKWVVWTELYEMACVLDFLPPRVDFVTGMHRILIEPDTGHIFFTCCKFFLEQNTFFFYFFVRCFINNLHILPDFRPLQKTRYPACLLPVSGRIPNRKRLDYPAICQVHP